jgi:hypothetical protein
MICFSNGAHSIRAGTKTKDLLSRPEYLFPMRVYHAGVCMPQIILEGRMTRSAIRLLTLIVCAMVLGAVAAKAETSRGKHVKKHAMHVRHIGYGTDFGGHQTADRAWPAARPLSQSGDVCPGIGRSFECRIWPPPIGEDPDRKASGSDGG